MDATDSIIITNYSTVILQRSPMNKIVDRRLCSSDRPIIVGAMQIILLGVGFGIDSLLTKIRVSVVEKLRCYIAVGRGCFNITPLRSDAFICASSLKKSIFLSKVDTELRRLTFIPISLKAWLECVVIYLRIITGEKNDRGTTLPILGY